MPSHRSAPRRVAHASPHVASAHRHRYITLFDELRFFFPSQVSAFRELVTRTRAHVMGRLPVCCCPLLGSLEVFLCPTSTMLLDRDVCLFEVFLRSCGYVPYVPSHTYVQFTVLSFTKVVRAVQHSKVHLLVPHA